MEAVAKRSASAQGANARQVGGDHYYTGDNTPQHWDLFGLDYLIGYAVKYMRWRKKGGVEDLEKAIHVIEKIKEVASSSGGPGYVGWPKYDARLVSQWSNACGLDWVEEQIVMHVMFSNSTRGQDAAIAGIRYLLSQSSRATGGQSPMSERRVPRQVEPDKKGPVPDADESRHASLYPWSVPRDRYMTMSQDRRSLLDRFYTQRGVNMLLDACVEGVTCLPRELQSCYSLTTNTGREPSYWVIEVSRVPDELREFYPRLHLELNAKEFDECPRWQQGLYSRTRDLDGKYRLLDRAMVWGPEL